MTDAEKVMFISTVTGETDDTLISAFLVMAGDALYHYVDPFKTQDKTAFLDEYSGVQARIAIDWLSKRGAEGQIAHSENGISRSYEASDISPSILRELTPFCGVV